MIGIVSDYYLDVYNTSVMQIPVGGWIEYSNSYILKSNENRVYLL